MHPPTIRAGPDPQRKPIPSRAPGGTASVRAIKPHRRQALLITELSPVREAKLPQVPLVRLHGRATINLQRTIREPAHDPLTRRPRVAPVGIRSRAPAMRVRRPAQAAEAAVLIEMPEPAEILPVAVRAALPATPIQTAEAAVKLHELSAALSSNRLRSQADGAPSRAHQNRRSPNRAASALKGAAQPPHLHRATP